MCIVEYKTRKSNPMNFIKYSIFNYKQRGSVSKVIPESKFFPQVKDPHHIKHPVKTSNKIKTYPKTIFTKNPVVTQLM